MLKLIDIFRGRTHVSAGLAAAIAASPCLTDAFAAGYTLAATPTPTNWAALLQLIMELLPEVLPLL